MQINGGKNVTRSKGEADGQLAGGSKANIQGP